MSDMIKSETRTSSSRRRFVGGTLQLPLAAYIAAALPWSGALGAEAAAPVNLNTAQGMALQRVLYLLFPLDELGEAPYARSLAALDQQAAAAPTLALLQSGLDALDQQAGGDWIARSEDAQVAALKAIEDSPFFQHLYGHAQATIFNDPAVWQLVGYEGSSMEFGGYANHGMNDIDWLDD